jgi:hypothetical protein
VQFDIQPREIAFKPLIAHAPLQRYFIQQAIALLEPVVPMAL